MYKTILVPLDGSKRAEAVLPRTFYGSVTAGVLQKIDRPLLIIRTRRVE